MAKAAKATKPKAKPKATPKAKSAPADQVLGTTEMAGVLGLTARRLQLMVKDGTVPSLGRGQFALGAVVQAYAQFLKEGADKRTASASLDNLREEKALDIRLNRLRKDRELIAMDEALSVIDDVTGLFVSYLTGLPAQITGVPRERQRLNDIIDLGRQKLADGFTERRSALLSGRQDIDPAGEDEPG